MANADETSGITATDARTFSFHSLDWQNAARGMQEAKRAIRASLALASGLAVLDVGCGTGDDARDIAARVGRTGRVVGIDAGETMIAEAQRRAADSGLPLTFAVGDAQHLDFDDNTFDRCRSERVGHFLADPERAIAEMARVTRPGGRVVVADVDWGAPIASDPVTQAILDANRRRLRRPTMGRDLGELFRACGLREVRVQPCVFSVVGAEWDAAFMQVFQPWVTRAVEAEAISAEMAAEWLAVMARDARDGVACMALPIFVVAGTKP